MQMKRYFPLSLLAVAMFSGCSTMPPENSALTAAQSSYNSARSNPQVTKLAAIELQDAGTTLDKANAASTKGDSVATVNQLAYLANQKVAIAQEIAKRKTADLNVANASVQRDQIRLAARTAEADAATQRALLAQQTADKRAMELAAAGAKAEKDQAQIAAKMAEVEAARKQAEIAKAAADKQAAALAEANAKAEQDQKLLAAKMAEIDDAKSQAVLAQEAANKQAAELAAAKAKAEQAQALIAQQDAQLKELNAKQTERGMVITLGDVLFNVNKADLSKGGLSNVKKLADFLTQYPERKVMVEGHTDNRGSDSYNQALSERRAEAVQKALVDLGISSDRIATKGYGESSPVANNEKAAGRQMNRRVEIVLSDESGTVVPHK